MSITGVAVSKILIFLRYHFHAIEIIVCNAMVVTDLELGEGRDDGKTPLHGHGERGEHGAG